MKVDIIQHRVECNGKNTASHAAVLAPDDVTIYAFPDVPVYDKSKVRDILISRVTNRVRAFVAYVIHR